MRVLRAFGIAIGALVILAVGLYAPATLLAPLPNATMAERDVTESTDGTPPALPDAGASAIAESAEGPVIARAGESEPVPMAGIAKVVTALVVLDAHPMSADEEGETVPITSRDFLRYNDYRDAGARVVTVYTDDTWSQRAMLQAVLLGSSNNHADTLAAWAFGSVDAYVNEAAKWLAQHELTDTTVVDATGLSPDDVSTASDLSRLAALAMANPVIPTVLEQDVSGIAEVRGVENTTSYMAERNVTGISRSFTTQAGICLLFAATVPVDDTTYTFYGAMVRMPDWDSLDASMSALMDSAEKGVHTGPVLPEGTPVATFTTPWGATADGVIGSSAAVTRWVGASPVVHVTTNGFALATEGDIVATASVSEGASTSDIPVKIDKTVHAPDVLWRLSHPIELIPAFVDQIFGG
ncbi:D-alanyl-D-alanine carboxypeptidase family protein [Paramicrobacterium agarici]|uniref:D-alanyl-D-alanine carboxypeptidase (Penicillin-binding protein 5/6) n=1 Tax=Paramicrobacterium agarici TaxID=630514 RepID=A0A2A9DY16_9MICO|nr:hypothetical protein [Microbacterium agarici]PFG31484.1 D-alanyl-D-alanine carboxypeptidase (penicillin-binding protein 5/6) [Microbacterium agarici]